VASERIYTQEKQSNYNRKLQMNLLEKTHRLNLIKDIESDANAARKQWSLRQFEVNGGRIQQYVKENLEGQMYEETVREMPIVSSINVQKAIVDKKSTIYKKRPKREFTDISDDQKEVLDRIYKDMKIDMKLNKSNKNFSFQDQSIGMIVPKNGKLEMRIFLMHQIDVIPDPTDPESASAYIISTFDRENYIQLYQDKKERDTATGNSGRSVRSSASAQDGENSEAANEFQFKKYVAKYVVWTKELNFMMNGFGEIIDQSTGEGNREADITSPLASRGIMPFFEVSRDKDFEFFVRASNSLTDFTIQFNERLSDLAMNAKMNGYAVAILKSPSTVKPQNLVIGHSQIVHLATDDPDQEVDFSFASPSSNIGEISAANDTFLNYFVTSEGLGGDVVNSRGDTEKATSGIDRFLQSIKKMEAHQDDYEKYRCLEQDIYKIIKAWLDVLGGDKKLDKKYQSPNLPEESEIEVDFDKPEMMQTETEKLSNIELKMELGLMSKREAIMELRSIEDADRADEIIKEIEKLDGVILPKPDQGLDFDSTVDEDDDE
jgi:hypothetical protein